MIGIVDTAAALLDSAGLTRDDGVIAIKGKGVGGFIEAAMLGRVWEREPAE